MALSRDQLSNKQYISATQWCIQPGTAGFLLNPSRWVSLYIHVHATSNDRVQERLCMIEILPYTKGNWEQYQMLDETIYVRPIGFRMSKMKCKDFYCSVETRYISCIGLVSKEQPWQNWSFHSFNKMTNYLEKGFQRTVSECVYSLKLIEHNVRSSVLAPK